MSQQINLYHPGLRPAQRPLTAARLALGVIVLGIALAGYYAFAEFQLHQSELALAETNSEFKALQEQILKLGGAAGQAGARNIEESIAKAEAEMRIREAVLKRLGGGDLGSTQGFSAYLTALARQRVEGVWITGLTVAGDSGDFTLQGGVSRPEMLLEYIRKLGREEVLKGRQIGDFRVVRRELDVREGRGVTAAMPPDRESGADTPQRWRFVEFSVGTGPSRGQPGT